MEGLFSSWHCQDFIPIWKRDGDPYCFQITASSKLQFKANDANIVLSATSFDFPRGSGKEME